MILTLGKIRTSINGKWSNTAQDTLIAQWVNNAKDEVEASHPWAFLRERSFVTTVAEVTAGDADVTNGSTTVSSNNGSTSWPVGVVGRKFRVSDESPFYDIDARVSATQITLKQPYQGDTATDQDYSIYQDEYKLTADILFPKHLRNMDIYERIEWINVDFLDEIEPTPNAYGNPNFVVLLGKEDDEYTTGTVSASNNTSVITGSSTVWSTQEGLSKGTKIKIGDDIYNIKSVDSDTQLTVYETISPAVAGSTAYVVYLNNFVIQLYTIPDSVRNYPYRYVRRSQPLINATDWPISWPEDMHKLIELRTLIDASDFNNDEQSYNRNQTRYEAELNRAIARHGNSALGRMTVMRSLDEARVSRRGPKMPQNMPISVSGFSRR